MRRTCLVCNEEKPLAQFLARGKGRSRICELCHDFATPEDWAEARRRTHHEYYMKRTH